MRAQLETIEDCQKRLDAAELARQPTTGIEGELAALRREYDSAVKDEVRATKQTEDDQVEREALTEVAAIAARIESVLPPLTIPTPAVDLASIAAATRVHQRARLERDQVVATLTEKKKVADAIAGLISEHKAILERIDDRLMAGAELPGDDMARLKWTQYLERKRPIYDAAKAEVAAAEETVRLAEQKRLRAREALTAVEDNVRRAGYVMRLETLDAQMIEYLGLVAAINKRQRLQTTRPYIGSHELRATLYRLADQHKVLADELNPNSLQHFNLRRAG